MDELILKTDKSKRVKSDIVVISVIFLIISLVCAYVLLRQSAWKSFAITEALVVASLAWTLFRSAKNGDVTLHFKGDTLCISYKDGRKYNIKDVDRKYFKLVQTEKEKAQDMGNLIIESTNFRVTYIKQFSLLTAYIESHFEGVKKSIYYFDDDEDEETEDNE